MQTTIAKLALLAVSLLAAFVIAEVAVRAGLVHDPIGAYLRIDGGGPEARARVVLLGDSFIDKRGDGAFHRLFVDAVRPGRLAVANLGVSGTGPGHYLETLARYGPDLEPDLVVLFYFAGNDLINVIEYDPPEPTAPRTLRDWLRPIVHRARLYHAVTELGASHTFDFEAMLADGHEPDLVDRARTGEVNPWLLLIPRDVRARYLGTNLSIESDESRRGVDRLRGVLDAIATTTASLDARLLIVVFPATTQVSRSHFEFYRRAGFDPDERTLVEATPQRVVSEIAADLNAPVLDLLPAFRAEARAGTELYRPYDSHLNDPGNRLAAERAGRFVLENLDEAKPPLR